MNRLAAAASSNMEDFDIDVKDSSGNVNLKCSPAFYAAVAKPALETLPPNWSSDPVAGCVGTSPVGATVLQDTTNIHQNSQLKINISTHTSPPTLLGAVCIHLHNTTCLVQIQGGKRAPDQRSLAVWSVENIILPLWSKFSRDTGFGPEVIAFIHKSILSAVSGPCKKPMSSASTIQTHAGPPTCGHCKKTIAKNLQPVLCSKQGCGKFFHKVDQPLHICIPVPRSPSVALQKQHQAPLTSAPNPPSYREARPQIDIDSENESDEEAPESQSSPLQSVNTIAIRPSSLTANSSVAPTGQQLLQEVVASLQGDQQVVPYPAPATAHNVIQQPAQSPGGAGAAHSPATSQGALQQSLSLQPPLAPSQASVRSKNSRTRPATPQLTPQGLQVELLNREITMAKTKVTVLDKTVTDLEAANKILVERIRLFEQKTNDAQYAEYFPKSNTPAPPVPSLSPTPRPAIPQPQPLQSISSSCCPTSSLLLSEVGTIKAQLEDLSGAVALLLRAAPHPEKPPSESLPPQPGAQEAPKTAQLATGHQAKGTSSPSNNQPQSSPAIATVTSTKAAERTAPVPAPTGYLIDLLLLDTPDSAEYLAGSAHFAGEEHQLPAPQINRRNYRGSGRSRPAPRHPLPPPPREPTPAPPPPRQARRALLPTPPGWGAAFRLQTTPQQPPQANPSQLPPAGRRRHTGSQRSKPYRPAPSKSSQPTEGILIDLNF